MTSDTEKKTRSLHELATDIVDEVLDGGDAYGVEVILKSLFQDYKAHLLEEVKERFDDVIRGYDYYCECEDSCGCAYDVAGGIEDDFLDKLKVLNEI